MTVGSKRGVRDDSDFWLFELIDNGYYCLM